MNNYDSLREQWGAATAALPWGAQRVFIDVLTLAQQEKTPSPLVWGRDYGDGGACLVNQGAQLLSALDGEGGYGKPSQMFGEVVSLFDQINQEFFKNDINFNKTVSPLAADILIQWFAPLKDQPLEEQVNEAQANEAFAQGIIPERSDEDMTRALMAMLSEPPPAVESPFPQSTDASTE